MPQRILAVELAGDRVRGAVAERAWSSFQFIGAYESERASDESDLSGALRRLVSQAGDPDIVVSALPSELVAKRLLELPFDDSRKLTQAVPFALEEHLPFAVDDAVVAFARVGKHEANSTVLAAFARKADLKQHLDLFLSVNLNPHIVTLAPYALGTLFSRARNGAEPVPHLVIETDREYTSMVLIDASGVPRAMRTVGASLVAIDGRAPSADTSARVVNALRQTVLAHAAEIQPHDLIVTGAGAAQPRVKTLLSDGLELTAREAGEFDCSTLFQGAQPDTSRYSTAVALLLNELPGRPADVLNFRQGEFAFRGRTRGDLTPFRTTFILAGVLAAMMVVDFAISASIRLHRLHVLDQQIAAIAGPALGEANPADPMQELRSGIASMNKQLRNIGGNLAQNSPLDTLLAVSSALPERFPVEMENVEFDDNGVKLTGSADSFGTVDQVKRALDASQQFGPIEVTHAKSADANKVEFLLTAQFKDAPEESGR